MVEIAINLRSVSMCIFRSYADDFQSPRVLIVFTGSPAACASVAPPTRYECPVSPLSLIPSARRATWVRCRNCAARKGVAFGLRVVGSMNAGKPSGVLIQAIAPILSVCTMTFLFHHKGPQRVTAGFRAETSLYVIDN